MSRGTPSESSAASMAAEKSSESPARPPRSSVSNSSCSASARTTLSRPNVLADFLIHNTSEVLTCAGPAPRRGAAQGNAGALARAIVASMKETIVFVGHEDDWRRHGTLTDDALSFDARGGAVLPGFVDAHTH